MKPLQETIRVKNQALDKIKKKAFAHAGRRAAEPRKGFPQIDLFEKEECPFSQRVRTRLSELGLDYVAHTVPDGNALKHEMLIRVGGKDQVPFLVDHSTGVKLYESDAILAYLESEYGKVEVPKEEAKGSQPTSEPWSIHIPEMLFGVIPRDQFEPVLSKLEGLINSAVNTAIHYSLEIIPRRFRAQS